MTDFAEAIEQRFGHQPDVRRSADLMDLLKARMRHAGARSYAEYQRILEGGRAEWEALAPLLTVPETYFFRMPAHFDALALEALPHILETNRKKRTLRILSAGCASGEEAYTIRILLNERFPQLADWNVSILGVDLSEAALLRARAGVYNEWSLRATSEARRRSNFEAVGKQFRLLPEARAGVEFKQGNLLEKVSAENCFDVIFCRNVLIYFSEAAMRLAIQRLTERLRVGGYLFLGPAESLRGVSREYELCHRHDSFFYRRKSRGASKAVPLPDLLNRNDLRSRDLAAGIAERMLLTEPALAEGDDSWFELIRSSSERLASLVSSPEPGKVRSAAARGKSSGVAVRTSESSLTDRVTKLVQQEKFQEAMLVLDQAQGDAGSAPVQHLLRALLLTNLGRFAEAERECGLTLAASETEAGAFYLLGLCAEQGGRLLEAQVHMERAIYLQPGFAMAQLHQGLIAKRAGDPALAKAALSRALPALGAEEASRLALFGGGFSREGLRMLCRRELERLEAA